MNCFPIYLVSLRLEDRQWCNLSWVLLFWLGLGCLLLPLLSIRFGHQLNYIPLASIKDHYEKVFLPAAQGCSGYAFLSSCSSCCWEWED